MNERGCLRAFSDTDPSLLRGRSPRRTPSEVAELDVHGRLETGGNVNGSSAIGPTDRRGPGDRQEYLVLRHLAATGNTTHPEAHLHRATQRAGRACAPSLRARPQSATSRSPPPRPGRRAECRRTGPCANAAGDPPGPASPARTRDPGRSRHRSTRRWTPPMNDVRSYCCASVPSACAASLKDHRGLPRAILLRLRGRRDGHLAPLAEDPVRRLRVRVESRVAGWWNCHQHVDMVRRHRAVNDRYLARNAFLSHHLARPLGDVSTEDLVRILRHPTRSTADPSPRARHGEIRPLQPPVPRQGG